MAARHVARAVALALALAGAIGACSSRVFHTFGARRYVAEQDCLEKGLAIDVIDGPDPGVCEKVRCWLASSGDVYVTTTACDAPVDFVDATGAPAGSPCGRALAAYARAPEATCESGGSGASDGGGIDAGLVDAAADGASGSDGAGGAI